MSEMHDILEALAIDVVGENGDELHALCPMHKERTGREDRNPSWWINAETGVSICFSCGYGASLAGLVADVMRFHNKLGSPDYAAAEEWLGNYRDSMEVAARRLNERRWVKDAPKAVPMTEARLAIYEDPPQWALDARKLTLESCHHYGILWDPKDEAWITPIRDPQDHSLMGWQMKGQSSRLFRNRPLGIAKSRTLFGYDAFEGGQMVVVESPLDCARLRSAGVEGGVAICGGVVSDRQIDLIRSADRIILAMDNPKLDKAGAQALERVFKASLDKGFDFTQFAYGDGEAKDPGDMTDDEIQAGLDGMRHCIFGLDALTQA